MGKDRSKPGPIPPWPREFRGPLSGISCAFCGATSRTVVVVTNPGGCQVGACEACSAHLCWTWRELDPDVDPSPPSDRPTKPSCVRVLVTKLARVEGGRADPGHPASYEALMVEQPDGDLDLPSAEVSDSESISAASARALAELGLGTWPALVESLYAAISPRGRLVEVTLALAYTDYLQALEIKPPSSTRKHDFRPWPPWDKAESMASLYLALRDVWPLRIAKHLAGDPRTSSITTQLRRGAAEYVKMQRDLRSAKSREDVDTSVAEMLYGGMSDDERLVVKKIKEIEEADAAEAPAEILADAQAEPGADVAADVAESLTDLGEDDFDPEDDPGSGA
jgi:hypothetical protein